MSKLQLIQNGKYFIINDHTVFIRIMGYEYVHMERCDIRNNIYGMFNNLVIRICNKKVKFQPYILW